MSEVLEFVINHWYGIASIAISLVSLIIIILKKNKNIDNNLLSVVSMLPIWINEAEKLEDKSAKYSYVFNHAIQELVALTGKQEKDLVDKYCVVLDENIERILSTPQKKVR